MAISLLSSTAASPAVRHVYGFGLCLYRRNVSEEVTLGSNKPSKSHPWRRRVCLNPARWLNIGDEFVLDVSESSEYADLDGMGVFVLERVEDTNPWTDTVRRVRVEVVDTREVVYVLTTELGTRQDPESYFRP